MEHGDEIASVGAAIAFATGNPVAGTALAYLALSIKITNSTNSIISSDNKGSALIQEIAGIAQDFMVGKISGKVLNNAYNSLPEEVIESIDKVGQIIGEQISEIMHQSTDYDEE